jgi:ABC-2 type transport system ATP-binding protein
VEAVVVDSVSKTFRIATDPADSLKQRIVRFRRGHFEEFQALHDLDLVIEQGETVGILGHNGSGKSTLLKCIAGILTPTTGVVRVRGRLASLLELGAGFHPDLTGRENVYINASFYGMTRKEVDKVFDDIVAFSDLAQFIDEPVKHYSSGMYVRLGFAVAVNLDPDVLLVDEVLAVGDEVFQAKCIGRIRQFQDEGRTIVFVTHDVETVRQVCSRAIVLDHGRMVIDDVPGRSIRVFREYLHGQPVLDDVAQVAETPLTITDVRLTHAAAGTRPHLLPGESFSVEVDVEATDLISDAVLTIEICGSDSAPIFKVSSDDLGSPLPPLATAATLRIDVGPVDLLDGQFPVNLTLSDRRTGRVYDWRAGSTGFEVVNPTRATGLVSFDVSVAVSGPAPTPADVTNGR